jgi:hypothetical protein
VDFKKAFDSVYRNALWFKLFKMGLDGKILVMFKAMYAVVKSCVKCCNDFSDFFDISIGLRQGQNNSPAMYALFLNDLELFLQSNIDSGISIFDICIMVLMIADDLVMVGHSIEDLQRSLNQLFEYCNKWGLGVNTMKTKIVVFRKMGRTLNDEKWFYNNEVIEIVDDFNYLGVTLNYTGSFVLNNQYLYGKALKAMHVLYQHLKSIYLSPCSSTKLFDAFVGSILNYAAPIWGFTKSKDLERIHLKFCKMILGIPQNSCNDAVYGELGRYPLYVKRYVQIIKYWLHIVNSDNIILKYVYRFLLEKCNLGVNNWAKRVKSLLDQFGFSDVWINSHNTNPKAFICLFKQRVIDCFQQKWQRDVENNNVLNTLYVHLKPSFGEEPYLKKVNSKYSRKFITKIRVSAHNLRIHSGRFGRDRVPREERKCQYCNTQDIEDEFHFILKCKKYDDIRKKYIKPFYWKSPNMIKFIELLKSQNKKDLVNLGKYLKEAKENVKFNNRICL